MQTRQTNPTTPTEPLPLKTPCRSDTRKERYKSHKLFKEYNLKYFNDEIKGFTIQYEKRRFNTSGYRDTATKTIKISDTLHARLGERELEYLSNTIVHEMIHAWVFLQGRVHDKANTDHEGLWLQTAKRINKMGETKITRFHDKRQAELVDTLRKYHFKCSKCGSEKRLFDNRDPKG